MKTQNLIIGVLTVAVVTLSILLFRTHFSPNNPNSPSEESISEVGALAESQLDKSLCAENLEDTDGGIIGLIDAQNAIKAFDRLHPNDSVLAFHFGLSHMQAMMDSIQTYNSAHEDEEDIIGVRFHRAITSRSFDNDEHQVTDKYDLVIVPTLRNGKDLHILREEEELFPIPSVPMYSYSRPCPKLCEGLN